MNSNRQFKRCFGEFTQLAISVPADDQSVFRNLLSGLEIPITRRKQGFAADSSRDVGRRISGPKAKGTQPGVAVLLRAAVELRLAGRFGDCYNCVTKVWWV
jgi:hypothetical protein